MWKLLVATSLLFGSLVACVDTDDADVELLDYEPPAEVRLDGAPALYGVVEYGTAWKHDWIEVCWEDDAFTGTFEEQSLKAEAREWVRLAVLEQWGSVSNLRFSGVWSNCASAPEADIRIGHNDLDGWSVFGTEASEIASGPTMTINLLGPAASQCVPDGGGGGGGTGGGGGGSIPACNGTLLGADPASRENWTEALALHLFGYALGLRKEDAHPNATPCLGVSEPLDSTTSDGEPLWAFDTASIMSTCQMKALAYGSVRPTLSAGDIRSMNTLYPGVVRIFANADLVGTSVGLGTGYFTRATTPAIASLSSVIVPPGFRVTACTSSACTVWTASKRTLTSTWDNQIQNLAISEVATVAEGRGYIGASQSLASGTYKASLGQLATVGDNAISSAWAAPGHAITLCTGETLSPLTCMSNVGGDFGGGGLIKLPGSPVNTFGVIAFDNAASYVKVSPRVVTYASQSYYDARSSLAEGVYTVSGGSTYLTTVRALLVPAGLEAVVCNGENPLAFPRPTCQTLTQSGVVSSTLWGNVKRLEVRVPATNAP